MKTKFLFIFLLCSIFAVISCTFEPVLPIKTPITDPIIKKPAIIKDTALLPPKTVYGAPVEN